MNNLSFVPKNELKKITLRNERETSIMDYILYREYMKDIRELWLEHEINEMISAV